MAEKDDKEAQTLGSPSFWQRRVPHIMGLYLAGSYTAFEMVQWVIKRFSLAPVYEDMALFALVSLLPIVALLAWGHGAPGRDRWSLPEKIALPLNLTATLLSLVLIWRADADPPAKASVDVANKDASIDAGSVTKVPVVNERATVLVFAFANRSETNDEDWLQHAIPLAMEIDLEQEPRISVHATSLSSLFSDQMRKAGLHEGLNVPVSLMREIARDSEYDHFASGWYRLDPDHAVIELTLYDCARGAVVATEEVEAADILTAIDMLTVRVRKSLGLSEEEIAQVSDLPVAEQGTALLPALRALSMALVADRFEGDFERGLALLDQALILDPTFAFGYFRKATMLIEHDKWLELPAAVQAAQKHSYRLSQASRSVLQVIQLWLVDKKPAEAVIATEQWIEREPRNVTALQLRANIKAGLGDMQGALAALEALQAVENKPLYLRGHADLLYSLGRFVEARDEYLSYSKQEPGDANGYIGIAEASTKLGEHDAALDAYRKAVAAQPNSPDVLRRLAEEMSSMGSYKQALEQYNQALLRSESPDERAESLEARGQFYWYRGQMRLALADVTKSWAAVDGHKAVEEMAALRLKSAWMFAMAGRRDEALAFATQAQPIMTADENSIGAFKYYALLVPLYLRLGDGAEARNASDKALALATSFGVTAERFAASRGQFFADIKEYGQAASSLRSYLAMYPTDSDAILRLAEVEYELGLDQSATDRVTEVLRSLPAAPKAHVLLAKLLARKAQPELAIEHLNTALKAWDSADEDFQAAMECRQLRASLLR